MEIPVRQEITGEQTAAQVQPAEQQEVQEAIQEIFRAEAQETAAVQEALLAQAAVPDPDRMEPRETAVRETVL